MNKMVHNVGDKVWVIQDQKVISAFVFHQEWWPSNKDNPVYYDLVDKNGIVVGTHGSGNFHSQEVWNNKEEAISCFKDWFEMEPSCVED